MEMGARRVDSGRPAPNRPCARIGCSTPVKKPTNKYCSVRCCAIDPERHERLRAQAQRNSRRSVLPMSRQLSLDVWAASLINPETEIDVLGEGREDVPRGMSRLTG